MQASATTVDSTPQESASRRNQLSELRFQNVKRMRFANILYGDTVIHRVDYSAMHFLAVGNLLYLHDNAWKGARPIDALNEHMGEGKWTQYMGSPCWIPSKTMRTPKSDRPARQHKKRCNCKFDPNTPYHAAYNPKLNLVENIFAFLDSTMMKNMRADSIKGKSWIMHGSGKKRFWKTQLRKAIRQLNKTDVFENCYDGFHRRCTAFIKSRGKRIKNQKW